MIDAEAVESIAEALHRPEQLGDVIVAPPNWVAKHKNELMKPDPAFAGPKAAALKVSTLGALRDYLKANRDGLPIDKLLVHVESPNRVTVGSALREPARDRELYITAEADDLTVGFVGKYQTAEDFNIGLQVRFVDADQRASLLNLVSMVKIEQSSQALDNGVSQTLEARAGVALKSHETLPNPVTLTPFRTFRDIVQPSSLFVLRANADAGKLPQLALFEADGGTWKLSAIQRVHDWLRHELGTLDIAILA